MAANIEKLQSVALNEDAAGRSKSAAYWVELMILGNV